MNTKCCFLLMGMLSGTALVTAGSPQEKRWIHPQATVLKLPPKMVGPFVRLADGSLLTVQHNATRTSTDDGQTWSAPRPIIYPANRPGVPSGVRGTSTYSKILRTRRGALVLIYMDMQKRVWGWDDTAGEPIEQVRQDVWVIRSLDEGKTWQDRQRIFQGYCGAVVDIIETSRSRIVVPVQRLLREPGRNATCTYVSIDQGLTWKRSNIIDLGGRGHHGGAYEATLAELRDGRLYMLMRTNLDRFWEAYSMDQGESWRVIQPSSIDASSAPGYLIRLTSGRLALVWNRLYPSGIASHARRSEQFAETPASLHREELSLAFSEDEARSWTQPVVLARDPAKLSYPIVFERRPGELWITSLFQGQLQLKIQEADFIGK